ASDTTPVYNVLILGPTQSGKSTFVENLKNYVDPDYVPAVTGGGNVSHTKQVSSKAVETRLPSYGLYDENDRLIDTSGIRKEASYHKLIIDDLKLVTRPTHVPGSPTYKFCFFDTPGLNDTDGNDIANVAEIFSTLSKKKVMHLNLIIITDNHFVPLFTSQKKAFETYFDLFDEMKTHVTIMHTHVDDMKRLRGMDKTFDKKLDERSEFFMEIE
ncbi:hypothetical protein BG005_003928, partial [Podila minutissima]